MQCPLPIDWLEYIEEGAQNKDFATHLTDCLPCQLLVNNLSREHRQRLAFRRMPRANDWPQWSIRTSASPIVGNIWLTEPVSTGVIQLGRLLVLVVTDVWTEAERSWCDVVPIITDVENATSLDLVLRSAETTLAVSLRLVLRHQMTIEVSQLEGIVGNMTAVGNQLLGEAIAGAAPNSRFGTPLDGPDDARLDSVRDLQAAARQLASRYADAVEQRNQGAGQLLVFSLHRMASEAPRELTLAAETTLRPREHRWSAVVKDVLRVSGRVDYVLDSDELFFVIETFDVKRFTRDWHAQIMFWLTELTDPLSSEIFQPRIGVKVRLATGILRNRISRMELRFSHDA